MSKIHLLIRAANCSTTVQQSEMAWSWHCICNKQSPKSTIPALRDNSQCIWPTRNGPKRNVRSVCESIRTAREKTKVRDKDNQEHTESHVQWDFPVFSEFLKILNSRLNFKFRSRSMSCTRRLWCLWFMTMTDYRKTIRWVSCQFPWNRLISASPLISKEHCRNQKRMMRWVTTNWPQISSFFNFLFFVQKTLIL